MTIKMDKEGVDGAIIYPPSWDPNSRELALESARQDSGRLFILGEVPVNDAKSA